MTSRSPAGFWDAIARRYDRVYAPSRDESRARLSRVARALAERSHILDLGVGTGRELSTLLDAGHTVVGLDISPEMLAVCARRTRSVALVRADLWQRMPWDDSSFDAVIALHGTLSHPPSLEVLRAFPGEVARLLRAEGVFVAEVPSIEWLTQAIAANAPGIEQIGEGRARFVDDATGVSIEAWFLSQEEWTELFRPVLDLRIERVGDGELLLVGRARTSAET